MAAEAGDGFSLSLTDMPESVTCEEDRVEAPTMMRWRPPR